MSEFINAITKGIPPPGAIGCCVCGDKNRTLIVRNSKRICRKCYSEYLKEKTKGTWK